MNDIDVNKGRTILIEFKEKTERPDNCGQTSKVLCCDQHCVWREGGGRGDCFCY